MNSEIAIQKATAADAPSVAVLVGELLGEIMQAIEVQAFNFDFDETTARLADFINREKYFVFVARNDSDTVIGFIALYESYALYAEGAFGTIPELYVRPAHRANKLGRRLVAQAKSFGLSRGSGPVWKSRRHRCHSLIAP